MAGQEVFGVRVLSLYCPFSRYTMADLNPPPLFSPTNTESNVADSGSVIITHGEVSRPTVGPEAVPHHVQLHVDPDPDPTNTQNPSPPDHEPEKQVRSLLSLSNAHWIPDSFVRSRRTPDRASLRIPIKRVRQTLTTLTQRTNRHKLYDPQAA